jgi:hypothetical protein
VPSAIIPELLSSTQFRRANEDRVPGLERSGVAYGTQRAYSSGGCDGLRRLCFQASQEGAVIMKNNFHSPADAAADRMESQYGEYLPTPREIAEACREIRSRWTAREHRQRCVGRRQVFRRHLLHMPRAMRLELV